MRHVWALVAVVAAVPDARADGFAIGAAPVWFVTGGGTAGATVAAEHGGGFVGGELGLVRLRENRFVGLYTDAYYDIGAGGLYATLGPELGLLRRSRTFPIGVGVDGGAAVRTGERAIGATGRVFVSVVGSFAVFARYAYLDEHVVQVGVTLKFPLAPPFGAGAP